MKIKLKHLIMMVITALAMGLFVTAGVAADGPSAYVRYVDQGATVDISVYWDDSAAGGPFNCYWADDVVADGGSLDWSSSMSKNNGAGTIKYVTLEGATKYKNYYFKVANGSYVTVVRSFPVDFDNEANPERKQNDYAHGNFTPDTVMCGSCHVTHAALKSQLLRQATYYELCMSCHSNSNSQSKYDVEAGKVNVGGGTWVDSLAGPILSGFASSMHNVNDTGSVDTPVHGSDPTKILTFTCVSCHTAHGGKNDNYRLIKKTIYPANNDWNPQSVSLVAYAVVGGDPTAGEEAYYVSGNSEFCSSCHLDYDQGNAHEPGGVYQSVYRHPVTVGSTVYSVEPGDLFPTGGDNLPLQYYSGAASADKRTAVVCGTCHYAHGTPKSFNISLPPNGTQVADKNMLRLDNYGTCQSCHRK